MARLQPDSTMKQPKSSTQLFKQTVNSPSVFSETQSDLIFVEDYFAEMDDQFIKD